LARNDEGALLGIEADITVMATGGVGGLFAVTTNPRTARGDALGMAAVVGARMRDMEFVQFHPTAIDIGRDPAPLATEALRGDGAIEAGRQPYLDCRKAVGSHFPDEFPTVFESCMSAGIDPRSQLIPIAPAVHYHMGGIATDSFGQSNLEGLLAVGECSAVGVHGANRLASNSLLEATVFGGRAAEYINSREWSEKRAGTIRQQPWLSMGPDVSQSLRNAMTANCGVRRSAQKFEESRGGHYRDDFPEMKDKAVSSYITYDRLD